MPLPSGAAAALASDMGKNGIGAGKPADMPEMPDDGKDGDEIYKQICGDVFDAVKSGNKDQFAQFMMELLEHYHGDEESKEGEAPEEV